MLIVRLRVTILSQPFEVCKDAVAVESLAKYVFPFQDKLSQAVIVSVIDVLLLTVRFKMNVLSASATSTAGLNTVKLVSEL